tara:strand:+ start:17761 stop:18771 length:1011 start_codon:yes stop_codon:yes gene_type:complete
VKISNTRVLVTGGSGFIPSHVTRRLVGNGADVAITTKYNSLIDNVRIADFWDDVRVIEADIRNQDSLRQIVDFRPEVVIHMAAYNHVGDSFTHYSEAMQSNAVGTANVLEAYEDYERFIYISSSEVYGFQSDVPFVETMTPHPISPYSVGKYGGELYSQMKLQWADRRISVVRPFNAFGPYQSPRAVIAEVILDCLKGRPIRATEGKQTRDFNYVENLVDGILLVCQEDAAVGQILNLGSEVETSIRDLITTIHELTESQSELQIGVLPTRPTEIWRMVSDSTRAREVIGWSPNIDLIEGLEKTIEWYRSFLSTYTGTDSPLASLGPELSLQKPNS